MAVSQEQVIWVYRVLLGRDPESAEVINRHLDVPDFNTLRQAFIHSAEFESLRGSSVAPPADDWPLIGRYLDVETIDVQIESSPAERASMLARIAEEWRKFGETDPHWSVLTDDQFRAGSIGKNIDAFYDSGKESAKAALRPLKRAGKSAENFSKAMDFGCGVGRLTLALAQYADQVVGVDISAPHIALARQRAQQVGADNVAFETISHLDDLGRFSDFDLITSMIVLQHNPPPVMAALFEGLLRALRIGGVAVIQIPTYISGQIFSVADYLANEQPPMEMNMLPQTIAFEIIDRAGCLVLEVCEDCAIGPMGVSQTFAVQRVR